MNILYLLAAVPLLIGAAPAVDMQTKSDLRCLLAVSSIANSNDKNAAMAGLIGSQYFLGRIDGRAPTLDLEAALATEVATLGAAQVPALLQSCGKLLEERGRALKAIGERMEKKGVQPSPSSSSS